MIKSCFITQIKCGEQGNQGKNITKTQLIIQIISCWHKWFRSFLGYILYTRTDNSEPTNKLTDNGEPATW